MQIELRRSKRRKTILTEIKPDGRVILHVPYAMTRTAIQRLLEEQKDWIREHLEEQERKKRLSGGLPKLKREELQALADRAAEELPVLTAAYAEKIGVSYGRITIRNQRTRWGSCSAKGNLNYNCLLMLAPKTVQEYVVVHELCHRKEMNHSARFWAEVEKILPDYRERRTWLKENGGTLLARM